MSVSSSTNGPTTCKCAGIPGITAIPSHWRLLRNKFLFREINDRSNDGGEELLSVSQYTGVTKKADNLADNELLTNASSLEGYKRVKKNDLVTNIMLAWNGSLGVSPFDGIASPAYCVYRLQPEHNPWYFHHLLRTDVMKTNYRMVSTGIQDSRLRLYTDDFFSLSSIVPPRGEQDAIVAFLDRKLEKIDRFIAHKRRLIELLEEQKAHTVARFLTHGTNPNVPTKSSGLDWLPHIPAHWQRKPLKRLLSRIDYGTSQGTKEAGKIAVLTMGNIQNGEVVEPITGFLDEIDEMLLLDHHDLLFTRTNGNPDLVGKVGLFRGERSDRVSLASYLVRLRVRVPNDPVWLHYLLNSSVFWPYARSHALVNLQTNLNSTRYTALVITVPPPAEQRIIAQTITEKLAVIDAGKLRAEREIALMSEFRTSIIAEAVTGKIDCRRITK